VAYRMALHRATERPRQVQLTVVLEQNQSIRSVLPVEQMLEATRTPSPALHPRGLAGRSG
jgi:hypothetical protein